MYGMDNHGCFQSFSWSCTLNCRLPITIPILHKLLRCASSLPLTKYQILMFQAMCDTAFFCLFRGRRDYFFSTCPPPIQIHHLTKLVNEAQEVLGFKIKFVNFKHSYNQPPIYLVISPQSTFCPVKFLLHFLIARGDSQGGIFIQDDGSPVSISWFSTQLSSAIKLCGLNPSVYKGHSFRIGAASHGAEQGMSDPQIRTLGCWRSNAFLEYIRVSSFSS